jgi:carbon storage regulator
MLVLSRKPLQQIMIGSEIMITVVKIERNQVRLGIQAPPNVPILRQELTERQSDAHRPAIKANRRSSF